MFKFIHAADLHLDSPLRGLSEYEGAPVDEIRLAARRACQAMVDLAIAERVSAVVIAGDVYDGDWRDYNTGLFFVAQMARLREAGIRVCAIAGNHDAANRMTRALPLPANVSYLKTDEPETIVFDDVGLVVHGQSFGRAAETDDLSRRYPAPRKGMFNLGLLHTCAGGREGHERYAPCTLEGLVARGYDYWALGHVHARETLSEEPFIAFSGNIQGRHARETGPKGCLLVTVDDRLQATAEFRPLDVVRWERVVIDLAGVASRDDVLTRAAEAIHALEGAAQTQTLAVRVELAAKRDTNLRALADRRGLTEELRAAAMDRGQGNAWIEKVAFRTRRDDIEAPAAGDMQGPLGELAALVAELRSEPDRLRDLVSDLGEMRLPAELTGPEGAVRIDDAAWLRSLLDEVEPLLFDQLVARDESP